MLIATVATWLGTIMSELGMKTSGNVISSLSLLVGGIFAIIGGVKFVKILLTKRQSDDTANNSDQNGH